jgi:hypothetical protein
MRHFHAIYRPYTITGRAIFTGLAILSLGAVATSAAAAADLHVCAQTCSYATIQSAINNAHNGDVIHIAAGTYFENLRVAGKSVTLLGAGEDNTVIDGRFRNPVVTLGQTGDPETPLESIIGVTTTHGSGPFGGGISVLSAVLHLQNSIVTSNQATQDGGGIDFETPGAAGNEVLKSMITHNRAAMLGGGIRAGAEAIVQITNSTIARNTAGLRGGGVHGEGASEATITDSTVSDNTSQQDGGGIYVENGVPSAGVTLVGTSVVRNTATRDGGGLDAAGRAAVSTSVFARNTAGRNGGGLIDGHAGRTEAERRSTMCS